MKATEKQIEFVQTLSSEVAEIVGFTPEEEVQLERIRKSWKRIPQDAGVASSVISTLLNIKKAHGVSRTLPVEGMHKVGDRIFKVQVAVHGSGNLYAKELIEDTNGWRFEYSSGSVGYLTEKTLMSLEDAKAFGSLYGVCCMCGRILTNESSIADGIGPICAGKF